MIAIKPTQILQKHPSEMIRGAHDTQKERKDKNCLTFGRTISNSVAFWEYGFPKLSGMTASHSYPSQTFSDFSRTWLQHSGQEAMRSWLSEPWVRRRWVLFLGDLENEMLSIEYFLFSAGSRVLWYLGNSTRRSQLLFKYGVKPCILTHTACHSASVHTLSVTCRACTLYMGLSSRGSGFLSVTVVFVRAWGPLLVEGWMLSLI